MKLYNRLTALFVSICCMNVVFADHFGDFDNGQFQFSASMTVAVDGHSDGDDELAAFDADGNLRGLGIAYDAPFGPYAGQTLHDITLYSSAEGDEITFKLYDASGGEDLDLDYSYSFIINDAIGDVVDPLVLEVGASYPTAPPCEDVGLFGGSMSCAAAADYCGTIAFGTEDVDLLCPLLLDEVIGGGCLVFIHG